jgi:hypothetical protein
LGWPFLGAWLAALLKLLLPSSTYVVDWIYGNVWLTLLPICLGIAITCYRLFDIDIIIRRTLVYSILTLTLGLVYIGCIVLLQQLAVPFVGGSELAIVASTLAIGGAVHPAARDATARTIRFATMMATGTICRAVA